MPCLCGKLRAAQYNNITNDEVSLLRKVHRDANWLFNDSAVELVDKLRNSYQTKNLVNIQQWSQPSQFLNYGQVKTKDNLVRLVIILQRFESTLPQIQKRTLCVALADSHPLGNNLEDLVTRVRNSDEIPSLGDDKKARTKLKQLIYIGRKWRNIIAACAKYYPGSLNESEVSGVLWILGRGSSWEKASEDDLKSVFVEFNEDFYKTCRELAPMVELTLNHLRGEVNYHPYEPSRSQYSGDLTGTAPKRRRLQSSPNTATARSSAAVDDFTNPQTLDITVDVRDIVTHTEGLQVYTASYNQKSSGSAAQSQIPRPGQATNAQEYLDQPLPPRFIDVSDIITHSPDPRPSQATSIAEGTFKSLILPEYPKKAEPATVLLSLLRFLVNPEQSIRKSLLLVGGEKKMNWASTGDLYSFYASDIGLYPATVSLLQNEDKLQETLDQLEAIGSIRQHRSTGDVFVFTTANVAGKDISGPEDWKQAMILVSFFFGGCEYTKDFYRHGKWALSTFQRLLDQYQAKIDPLLAEQVVPALLQASKFSTQQWKLRAIEIAETIGISHLAKHIRAYFAYRKSLILRTNRDVTGAKQAISAYFEQDVGPVDQRLNTIHGYLQHSLAWIAIEAGQFQEALKFATSWGPFCSGQSSPSVAEVAANCSLYELRVFLRLLTMKGIAKMHNRRYPDAITDFECALRTYDEGSRARHIVLAYTIDACCEHKDLEKAHKLSTGEFERLKLTPSEMERAHFDDHYVREIFISTAELYVRLGEHERAISLLLRLKSFFDAAQVIIQNNQQRHVRVLILLAQSLHQHATEPEQWESALDAWFEVVEAAKKYPVLDTTGWDFGLVCFSVYHAKTMLGTEDDVWLDKGSANFDAEDHFWRCGMPTYWLDYILEHVPNIPDGTRTRMTRSTEAIGGGVIIGE